MGILKYCSAPPLLAVSCLLAAPCSIRADDPTLVPTHKDVAYGDRDNSQKLDVYLTESDTPTPVMVYIHGGGWRGGSKNRIPDWIMDGLRKKQFSVVSVEYRFTDVATHPAQTDDCTRAIQFLRHKAADWNIDPERVGVSGNSAGGHLALWVALHDDTADAESSDPVRKQSSRVACAVSLAGPTDWSLLRTVEHLHPGYRQLLGYEAKTPVDEMDVQAMSDASPISFVTLDDPPILLIHGDRDRIVPPEHALNLREKLKNAEVVTELILIEGGTHISGATPKVFEDAGLFVRKHLRIP